jgi:hypothetical protein
MIVIMMLVLACSNPAGFGAGQAVVEESGASGVTGGGSEGGGSTEDKAAIQLNVGDTVSFSSTLSYSRYLWISIRNLSSDISTGELKIRLSDYDYDKFTVSYKGASYGVTGDDPGISVPVNSVDPNSMDDFRIIPVAGIPLGEYNVKVEVSGAGIESPVSTEVHFGLYLTEPQVAYAKMDGLRKMHLHNRYNDVPITNLTLTVEKGTISYIGSYFSVPAGTTGEGTSCVHIPELSVWGLFDFFVKWDTPGNNTLHISGTNLEDMTLSVGHVSP